MIKKYSQLNLEENPNFKQWFGASKVVDVSGNPLVVYHGGGQQITEFSKNPPNRGVLGVAYFTSSLKIAWKYALGGGIDKELSLSQYRRKQLEQLPERQPIVTKAYLRIENPLPLTNLWQTIPEIFTTEELIFTFKNTPTYDILNNLAEENEISLFELLQDWNSLLDTLTSDLFLEHDNLALSEYPELKFLLITGLYGKFMEKGSFDGVVFYDFETECNTYVPLTNSQIKIIS